MTEYSIKDELVFLVKRAIALPAKLLEFKSFIFYAATALLYWNLIDQTIWLSVVLAILAGRYGCKVADGLKTRGPLKNEQTVTQNNTDNTAVLTSSRTRRSKHKSSASCCESASVKSVIAKGKEQARSLLTGK